MRNTVVRGLRTVASKTALMGTPVTRLEVILGGAGCCTSQAPFVFVTIPQDCRVEEFLDQLDELRERIAVHIESLETNHG